MNYKIPFIRPSFPEKEKLTEDYESILASNRYTNFGPFERTFAKAIAEYIGPEYHSATFSNATAGLMASIIGLLGKGDMSKYIVMPAFTFAAVAEATVWCGYKPLFVDIEPPGLHMSFEKARGAVRSYFRETAAMLFCNAFGVGTRDVAAWEGFSEECGKPLIIDSAAGFGSYYNGSRKVGTAGQCEVFSFHATKPFSIGEGGAVVSRDREFIKVLERIQNFGLDETRKSVSLGFNAKLQEINAAIGLRQLAIFEDKLARRKQSYRNMVQRLDPHNFSFQLNAERSSLCFATILVADNQTRDQLLDQLLRRGVEAKTYYTPLNRHPYFQDTRVYSDLENTDWVGGTVLSLPIHDDMEEDDIAIITGALAE